MLGEELAERHVGRLVDDEADVALVAERPAMRMVEPYSRSLRLRLATSRTVSVRSLDHASER